MAASGAKAMPNGSALMPWPQRPAYVFTPGLRHTLRPRRFRHRRPRAGAFRAADDRSL